MGMVLHGTNGSRSRKIDVLRNSEVVCEKNKRSSLSEEEARKARREKLLKEFVDGGNRKSCCNANGNANHRNCVEEF